MYENVYESNRNERARLHLTDIATIYEFEMYMASCIYNRDFYIREKDKEISKS